MTKRPSRHNEVWTPEEVRHLETLAGRGTPVRKIAGKLGRSERAVRSKAYKESIALRPTAAQSLYEPAYRGLVGVTTRIMRDASEKATAGVVRYVRDNTGQAVLIAAAAGCALGLLLGGTKGGSKK